MSRTPCRTTSSIEQVKAGTGTTPRPTSTPSSPPGSGLSDIEAIEGRRHRRGARGESDAFTDLTDPEVEGRWLDWRPSARRRRTVSLIGYGTDIGPEGICYRSDLFKKAGLPTDREEVAALFGHLGRLLRRWATSS